MSSDKPLPFGNDFVERVYAQIAKIVPGRRWKKTVLVA
jgi:hypothetical protein